MSILIIEDDPFSQLLYKAHFQNSSLIKSLDVSCSFTSTGTSGLIKAQRSLPRLIILDIKLPDMDGTQVALRLKNNPATANIPILAVTALVFEHDKERVLASGVTAYLPKPYLLEDLEELIARFVRDKKDCSLCQAS